jgi:hypothetical protein
LFLFGAEQFKQVALADAALAGQDDDLLFVEVSLNFVEILLA